MTIIFIFGMGIMLVGYVLLILTLRKKQKESSVELDAKHTEAAQTTLVSATSVPLRGKPSALKQEKGMYIPVLTKPGTTPKEPYVHHTMELMALCLVLTEKYGVRSPGGILQYPQAVFKVAFTPEAEDAVRRTIKEIQEHKQRGTAFSCSHKEHN